MQRAGSQRISKLLIWVAPLATLAISPWSNFDPINLIKMLVVSSVGFATAGILLGNFKKYKKDEIHKLFWIASILFLICLFSTFIFSGAPIPQQIWGQFGRSTGLVAYISLIFVTLGASSIQHRTFHEKLVKSLFLTTIPMTAYCLLQIANLDPIKWSSYAPFGTLGNINFLSAFFGISSVALFSLLLEQSIKLTKKLAYIFLIIVDLVIVVTTGSIQGFMIFVAGAGLALMFYILKSEKFKSFAKVYLILAFVGFLLTALGLSNLGPLAKYIFQPSVIYRTDYWHAGWVMTVQHPFFGVGLDSYGDWYRQVRGEISTIRTDPNRISNTAHSIFLDISSNGGFPLLVAYLSIVLIAFFVGIRKIKLMTKYDSIYVAIFSAWLAYQIQSFISINQIGVGIWGWLFTGAIISYPLETHNSVNISTSKIKKSKSKLQKISNDLSPATSLLAILGFLIGFFLAFIPLNADAKFKAANNKLDGVALIAAIRTIGSTSFHAENAMNAFIKSNLAPQAKEVTDYLLENYPRDFAGWGARAVLNSSTPEQKAEAMKKLKELDPFNPGVRTNP